MIHKVFGTGIFSCLLEQLDRDINKSASRKIRLGKERGKVLR